MQVLEKHFEPHVWDGVVLKDCDPKSHEWADDGFKGRWTKFVDALRPIVSGITDDAQRQVDAAIDAIEKATNTFLETVHGYTDELVDRLLDMPEFQSSYASFLTAAAKARTPKRQSKARYGVGPALERTFREHSAHAAHARELNRLLQQVRDTHRSGRLKSVTLEICTPENDRKSNLFWFVYDPMIPADISDAMLGRLESEAAYMLSSSDHPWTEADRIALVEHRARSFRRWARFIAGCEGSQVSIIPADERMNVAAVIEKHAKGRANLDAQLPRLREEATK